MKRKSVKGEILIRDCDLTISQAQAINAGKYVVYVRRGRVAYDGIRYTNKGRVVLYYQFTAPGTGNCERWVIRGTPLFLVPTGKPE